MENNFQSRSQQATSRNHIQQKVQKGDKYYFAFNNNNVSHVNFQTYLGFILDVKLTFEKHLKNVFNKTNKTIGLLKKLSNLLPRQALVTIYKAFIQIMVMYSMTKLLIILSTQKWNPFNIMPVQQSQELFEVCQEKKYTKNQAQSPFNFAVGTRNFDSFMKSSKMILQSTFFISFL